MKKDIIPAILAIAFAVGGIWGLYNKVGHTGWLLFAGILIALSYDWGKKK